MADGGGACRRVGSNDGDTGFGAPCRECRQAKARNEAEVAATARTARKRVIVKLAARDREY